ncbi:hypothetical protein ACIGAN_23040 [Streptomyces sp. NPDC085931]|uniref:hypothetical protein n=1 Tax=Streptomyces sp. NPDC085931 TaxID=3365740 RepID=UPI0037CFCBB1
MCRRLAVPPGRPARAVTVRTLTTPARGTPRGLVIGLAGRVAGGTLSDLGVGIALGFGFGFGFGFDAVVVHALPRLTPAQRFR